MRTPICRPQAWNPKSYWTKTQFLLYCDCNTSKNLKLMSTQEKAARNVTSLPQRKKNYSTRADALQMIHFSITITGVSGCLYYYKYGNFTKIWSFLINRWLYYSYISLVNPWWAFVLKNRLPSIMITISSLASIETILLHVKTIFLKYARILCISMCM